MAVNGYNKSLGWHQLSPSRTIVSSFTPYCRRYQQEVPSRPGIHTSGSNAAIHASASIMDITISEMTTTKTKDTPDYYDDGDWALCLAQPSNGFQNNCQNNTTFACALSNGEVQVYDTERLHRLQTFHHHSINYRNCPSNLIADICYGPCQTIVTCGHDGTVSIFDIRAPNRNSHQDDTTAVPVMRGSLPAGQSAFSVALGFDGYLAAVASTRGRIHFLDLRANGALLGSYRDSHVDDVTRLVFSGQKLLSGSEDGLVCLFDTTQPTEVNALQSVCSVGAPIRRLGFCGDLNSDVVYCLTGSETASLWNIETASCIKNFGLNLRQDLTNTLGMNTTQTQIDYLVDASWDTKYQEFVLVAGNASGDAAVFRLASDHGRNMYHWDPCHVLTGGHRGVVRACCHLTSNIMITAGEDARLCEWNRVVRRQGFPKATHNTTACASVAVQHRPFHALHRHIHRASWLDSTSTPAITAGGGGPIRRRLRHRQTPAPY